MKVGTAARGLAGVVGSLGMDAKALPNKPLSQLHAGWVSSRLGGDIDGEGAEEKIGRVLSRFSDFEGFKVTGKIPMNENDASLPAFPCEVKQGATGDTIECTFHTQKTMAETGDQPTAPPTDTSLNAEVVIEDCDAGVITVPVDRETNNANIEVTKESSSITPPSSDEKNCNNAVPLATNSESLNYWDTESEQAVCIIKKPFCARGELFDTSTVDSIGIFAEILQGYVTYKYETEGTFTTEVAAQEYTPTAATTVDQGSDGEVLAYRCNSDGADNLSDGSLNDPLEMGSTLHVCVYSDNPLVSVVVTDLVLKKKSGDSSLEVGATVSEVLTDSVANLVTEVKTLGDVGAKKNVKAVGSLMTPTIFDAAGGDTLDATGSVTLTYVDGARMLKQVRRLQTAKFETFSVEFDLAKDQLPEIAMQQSIENGANAIGLFKAMATMLAVGAYMIMM